MVATSIGLPLWQTGLVVMSIVFGQFAGALVGYRLCHMNLPLRTLQAMVLVASGLLLASTAVAAAVNGVQYDAFIARMVKDSFYCTYFGAVRGLAWAQIVALSIAVIGNVVEAALLVCGRRRLGVVKAIASCSICGASCIPIVIFDGMPLVMATALFQSSFIFLLSRTRSRHRRDDALSVKAD